MKTDQQQTEVDKLCSANISWHCIETDSIKTGVIHGASQSDLIQMEKCGVRIDSHHSPQLAAKPNKL